MHDSLKDFLKCPHCSGSLSISGAEYANRIIMSGRLACARCKQSFEIVRGIPRFLLGETYAGSFGFQWKRFYDVQIDAISRNKESENTFIEKTGFTSADVKGKVILDAGVGAGRFADLVARWRCKKAVGVDLSEAVETAFNNVGDRDNVDIVQADIFSLPFEKESFDIIYSIGVLHHTPDTKKAFMHLVPFLKKGGVFAIYVYSAYARKRIWIGSEILRKATPKLPVKLIYYLSALAIPVYYLYKFPLFDLWLYPLFPISRHPNWKHRWLETFDWYTPIYQWKHTYAEVYNWFKEAGFTEIEPLDYPVCMRGVKG
ncbi:MAG: methyltransferase domain-containing protein [Deltaproteobacteria bacterium]|nr:methyltransferase domain-containing protein [Deltaproteobacteria bacterium]